MCLKSVSSPRQSFGERTQASGSFFFVYWESFLKSDCNVALTGCPHHSLSLQCETNSFILLSHLSVCLCLFIASSSITPSHYPPLLTREAFPHTMLRIQRLIITSAVVEMISCFTLYRLPCCTVCHRRMSYFFLFGQPWKTERNLQSSLLFYSPFTDKSKFHYAN